MSIPLKIPEFGKIARSCAPDKAWRRLQRLDERHSKKAGDSIFDWRFINHVVAKNWVGVVQVPGLTIEILPKLVDVDADSKASLSLAQRNLLFMLGYARRLPVRRRDLAQLETRRAPILEALIRAFAEKLLSELGRGIQHEYICREENLSYVRGKILVSQHIRRNIAHRERVFVAHDEFSQDSLLNQTLKAAATALISITRVAWTQRCLRECLFHLGDVSDLRPDEGVLDRLTLGRNSERFQPLFDFARLVIQGSSVAPSGGKDRSFSLLFPMETIFEEFVGNYILKHAAEFGLRRQDVHLQAKRHKKWLLRRDDGNWRFGLRPDIVIDGDNKQPRLIIDTKWKRLRGSVEDRRGGVSQADLYQLYAYATRYNCPDNILLFPAVPGVEGANYFVPNQGSQRARVAFLDIGCDLWWNRSSVREGFLSFL